MKTPVLVLAICVIAFGTQKSDTTTITATANDDVTYITLHSMGFNITGKKSLIFKAKSCDDAIIRFYPDGSKAGDPGYKFRLNRDANGNTVAFGRLCFVKPDTTFNCIDKTEVEMESFCDAFNEFWIHFDDKGTAEFGEGCDIGKNRMFTLTSDIPFHLWDVRLSSHASWVFGQVCQVDDTQLESSTSSPKPDKTTTTAKLKSETMTTASTKSDAFTAASSTFAEGEVSNNNDDSQKGSSGNGSETTKINKINPVTSRPSLTIY